MVLSIVAFVLLKPFLPTKLFPEAQASLKNIVVDSLMLEALAEEEVVTQVVVSDSASTSNASSRKPNNYAFTETDYVGYQHLVAFFEKLHRLEQTGKGNVRIAYYGDSMNDGDMIVQDFRANFQDRFGGNGVGFVNIASESSASRGTVKHQHSKKWKTVSFVNTKSYSSPFGVSGNVFFANDTNASYWVNYEASYFKHLTSLAKPVLYYGKSKNKNGKLLVIQDKDTVYKTLNPSQLLNVLPLTDSGKKLKLVFQNADSIPFYGVDFESESGVYVDNFSNRGNSGLPLTSLKSDVLKAFDAKLQYDLIILQYGTNVLGNGSKNFGWYENRMKTVIAHLRAAMPNVAIVVVSVADKATKYNAQMQTDSAVVPLIQAQQNYARDTESGFINLYQLMGGSGAMVKWADGEPAKANKDYTHFNYRGSKLVADLLYDKFMLGYAEFLKQQKPDVATPIDSLTVSAKSN
ncbi:hypothetical protein K5I29_13255 [Flavobacterium agricola]|uniref:SGNH hydrolase-type esterase domain-containing protein n=1 Tax=Flavobacterium agricola TaxID=2870839 RepID=A0ABY6LYL0_9FLAO|nr:GDSL-type esterase/lipase family protein [Flavobacterium agricola]UYW01376.1 hypothetical protein K5I29_13255 [Flavobacterium agricola]